MKRLFEYLRLLDFSLNWLKNLASRNLVKKRSVFFPCSIFVCDVMPVPEIEASSSQRATARLVEQSNFGWSVVDNVFSTAASLFSLGPQELIGGFDSSRKPFDGELASLTLWPEVEKIFGHGYEV